MAKKSARKKPRGRIILRTGEALVEAEAAWSAAEPEIVIGELDGPVGQALANLIGDQVKGHTRVFAILNSDVQVKPATVMVSKVTVKDALGLQNTIDVPLAVADKLAIPRQVLRSAAVGVAYAARVRSTGGVGPKTWSAKLPAGLRINARTGVITGKARKAGTVKVTVKVTDKFDVVSKATLTLKIVGASARR